MASKDDIANVNLLFDAIRREREALEAGQRPAAGGLFKMIDGPPGMGIYRTGDDGWQALGHLTASAMASARIAQRADVAKVRRALARVLVRKFMTESLVVDQRNVDRALSEAAKRAKRDFRTLTHFIPCQLSSGSEPIGLSLGRIRFLSRREAKAALRDMLRSERAAVSEWPRDDREHFLAAIRHQRGHRWFVQVPVEGCAQDRSEQIAVLAASSALDFLQVILGARNSQRMTFDARPALYERTASIVRDDISGRANVATGWKAMGQGLSEGWTVDILKGEEAFALDQAGAILESRLNPDLNYPLAHRMLDVVQWYGEAVRDRSASTRLVKFVTSLERLTLTRRCPEGEPDRIAETVSDRIAALVTGWFPERTFEQNKAVFKRIYGIRSELVHGSISPLHPKVAGAVTEANDFCEHAINRALGVWSRDDFLNSELTVDQLDAWFERVLASFGQEIGHAQIEDDGE